MEMASADAFKLLPKELIELIFSELGPVDLANSSGVNLNWRKVASSDLLWRNFFNDYQHITEPLKVVYGNRKVNWMTRNYKLSTLEHPHGTYYIAKTFPNSNVLYTGCLADVMEEWDMAKAEKICEYEVPSGPASNYRMDETHCLFERDNALKRWKRHKNAQAYGDEPWDFVFENMKPDENGWIKLFQSYQFMRERCFMASVKMPGTLIVHLYDMDKNVCLWVYELKVWEQPPNPDNDPDIMGYLPKLEWDALAMSYDLATVVYEDQVIVFDLNKHEVKFHLRDEVQNNVLVHGRSAFSVCAIYKDTLLASKQNKTNFYSLTDGELLFSVPLNDDHNDYRGSLMSWAQMDGEKAVVCSSRDACLIDIQKRALIGTLEWASVARGWTQDVAMNDDFFVVLASNEVLLFDFRKRSKEQELKDAEELKKKKETYARELEEESARRIKEAEEAEERYQYRLEHPEEFPEDNFDYDSSSVSSEEQPIIPPMTAQPTPASNNSDEEYRDDSWGSVSSWGRGRGFSGRARGGRGRGFQAPARGFGRGNWGTSVDWAEPAEYALWEPQVEPEVETTWQLSPERETTWLPEPEEEVPEPEPEPDVPEEPEEELMSFEEYMRKKAAEGK